MHSKEVLEQLFENLLVSQLVGMDRQAHPVLVAHIKPWAGGPIQRRKLGVYNGSQKAELPLALDIAVRPA